MICREPIKILDRGYIRYVAHLSTGDSDIPESGIIEAARQSTQASFRSWEPYTVCQHCGWWSADVAPEHMADMLPVCTMLSGHVWKDYPKGDEGLLAFLYNGKPQHASPFEFCELVIEVQAPIFVFREWHRHRTQSYNEMSARYAPLPDLNYVPTIERCLRNSPPKHVVTKNKQAGVVDGAEVLTEIDAGEFREELDEMYIDQERFYQKWLKRGIPKELARIDLPVGRYSRMRAKANLRNWLAFLTLRSDPAAQEEIRTYATALETIIQACFPRTYDLFCKRREGAKP